jgi:hypothetical protein
MRQWYSWLQLRMAQNFLDFYRVLNESSTEIQAISISKPLAVPPHISIAFQPSNHKTLVST